MSIVYAREQSLGAADYIAVVGATSMRTRRPLANIPRVTAMLAGSNTIVTARESDGGIVGLARGISDGVWVCYLADLAVREDHQRRGIGTGLIRAMKDIVGPGIGIVLMAFPEAADYYRRIGLAEATAFFVDRENRA